MARSFQQYLEEEVFRDGRYNYKDSDQHNADIKVAEFGDGMGYTMPDDLQRAIEDENVAVWCIFDGWLHLEDDRDICPECGRPRDH